MQIPNIDNIMYEFILIFVSIHVLRTTLCRKSIKAPATKNGMWPNKKLKISCTRSRNRKNDFFSVSGA